MSQERRQDLENEDPFNASNLIDVLESMSPQEQEQELERVEEGLLGYESDHAEKSRSDEENEFSENRPKLVRVVRMVKDNPKKRKRDADGQMIKCAEKTLSFRFYWKSSGKYFYGTRSNVKTSNGSYQCYIRCHQKPVKNVHCKYNFQAVGKCLDEKHDDFLKLTNWQILFNPSPKPHALPNLPER